MGPSMGLSVERSIGAWIVHLSLWGVLATPPIFKRPRDLSVNKLAKKLETEF